MLSGFFNLAAAEKPRSGAIPWCCSGQAQSAAKGLLYLFSIRSSRCSAKSALSPFRHGSGPFATEGLSPIDTVYRSSAACWSSLSDSSRVRCAHPLFGSTGWGDLARSERRPNRISKAFHSPLCFPARIDRMPRQGCGLSRIGNCRSSGHLPDVTMSRSEKPSAPSVGRAIGISQADKIEVKQPDS